MLKDIKLSFENFPIFKINKIKRMSEFPLSPTIS